MSDNIELLKNTAERLESLLIWCQNSQELVRVESSVRSQIQLILAKTKGMSSADLSVVKRLIERSRESLRVVDRVRSKGHDLDGRVAVKANHTVDEIAQMEADGRLPPPRRD